MQPQTKLILWSACVIVRSLFLGHWIWHTLWELLDQPRFLCRCWKSGSHGTALAGEKLRKHLRCKALTLFFILFNFFYKLNFTLCNITHAESQVHYQYTSSRRQDLAQCGVPVHCLEQCEIHSPAKYITASAASGVCTHTHPARWLREAALHYPVATRDRLMGASSRNRAGFDREVSLSPYGKPILCECQRA